jgi:hypothetical protein
MYLRAEIDKKLKSINLSNMHQIIIISNMQYNPPLAEKSTSDGKCIIAFLRQNQLFQRNCTQKCLKMTKKKSKKVFLKKKLSFFFG